ncbi:MAG: hypothetical protein H6539_06270 [Bacteroidales bacterium]|nr:hypothetical protein [Bacteroidales bacterium]
MKKGIIISLILACAVVTKGFSQNNHEKFFKDVILHLDTLSFSMQKNSILSGNEKKLYFEYNSSSEVCEVNLLLSEPSKKGILNLLPSGDFDVIDSLLRTAEGEYQFKVQFHDLSKTEFLKFRFTWNTLSDSTQIHEVNLFPFTQSHVYFFPSGEELFIGEEKIFELVTDNIDNVKTINNWQTNNDIDYRVSSRFDQLRLHVIPKALGQKSFSFQLETFRPFLDSLGKISYKLPAIQQTFWVKQSRLRFVNIDRNDITLDENGKKDGVEIQLDNAPGLEMQKTYRIENQEEPGGGLIAELFTKNPLSNNRVLCILRVYNYHRESEGYLFIKDGDRAKYITNFSITPKTQISKISLLHQGMDWSSNLNVYPGETVDVKIEGESLNKAHFRFEDAEDISPDTTLRNENIANYKLKIPISVNKRSLGLFNNGNPTGYSLNIKEFQDPREFDFITLNYGAGDMNLAQIKGLIMSPKTIRDIVIDFDRNKIDTPEKLFGKQYLKMSVKITGRNAELIELRDIDNIVVVPGEKSPRASFYDRKDETTTAISLNKYLRKKSYDLEDWAKIELSIEDKQEKYSSTPFKKELELYVQKQTKFDIDVSFPAGLLINTFDKNSSGSQYQNFGGISMAMMAQFSFYDQERPGKYKPYKIGAGFLALNAFNLSSDPNVSRDMGIVVIGSLYPTRKDVKLTFPLHMGGGYKLNEGKWFILIGPGISVRL